MLTGALRPADARFVSIITMICLLAGTAAHAAASPRKKHATAAPVAASVKTGQPQNRAPVPAREWGPYLDVAYELTYWDKGEIREWREKTEQQLGSPLSAYIAAWSGKLASPANTPGAVREDTHQPVYRERDYLRLAIALTVDYLQTENLESLNSAEQLLAKLLDKATMPEFAYWSGFVKAQQALENNDAPQFVARVFDIWNNAVMYI